MPTLVGATGFEHEVPNSDTGYSGPFANIAAWASGGGFTTTSPIDGNSSLHLIGAAGSSYWIYNFVGTPNHLVAVCYVYLNSFSLPGAGSSLPILGFNWNGIGGGICILPDGTFGYSLFGGGSVGPTAVTNQLYRIEIEVDVSTSTWTITGGIAAVSSVTDTTALTSLGSGTSTQTANPPSGRIEVGSTLSNTFDALFDNVAWSHTLADFPIGPIQVRGYLPNAVGTHNLDASPSAFYLGYNGANTVPLTTVETTSYQDIDEIPTGADSAHIVVVPGSQSNSGGSATGAGTAAAITGTWNGVANATGPPSYAIGAGADITNAAADAPGKNGSGVLELSNFTGLVAGSTITALTVNVRYAANIVGLNGETVKIDLYNGTTLVTAGTAQVPNVTTYQDHSQSFSGVSIPAANLRVRVTVARGNTNTTYTAMVDAATLSAVSYTTPLEPSASLYAEYNFADETIITIAPALVVVGVVPDLDSSIATTWRAELFDSVQGTNVEDIYNASISTAAKTYQGKAFAQRPNSGGAWTLAAFNGLKLRFGLSAVVDGGSRLDGAIIEAVYLVAGATIISKTGGAIAQNISGGTYLKLTSITKTGGGVAPSATGGTRTTSFAKVGGGKSPNIAGGTKTTRYLKIGGGLIPSVTGGIRTTRFIKTGGGFTPSVSGGTKLVFTTYIKTGGSITAGLTGAPKRLLQIKIGGGRSPGITGTQKTVTTSKTGGSLSSGLAGAPKVLLTIHIGGGKSSGLAGGIWAFAYQKSGGGVSTGITGATRITRFIKAGGSLSSGITGTAKIVLQIKIGGGINAGSAGGTRTTRFSRTGGSISSGLSGSTRITFSIHVGGAISSGISGTTKQLISRHIGGAISSATGGASKNLLYAKQGGGLSSSIAGGNWHSVYVHSGGGVSQAASGTLKSVRFTKIAGAITHAVGGGNQTTGNIIKYQKAGGGIVLSFAGVTKSITAKKVGGSISPSVTGAIKLSSVRKAGGGITIGISGSLRSTAFSRIGGSQSSIVSGAAHAITIAKIAGSITTAVSGGVRFIEIAYTGGGITSAIAGSASGVIGRIKTGGISSSLVAGGTSTLGVGKTAGGISQTFGGTSKLIITLKEAGAISIVFGGGTYTTNFGQRAGINQVITSAQIKMPALVSTIKDDTSATSSKLRKPIIISAGEQRPVIISQTEE